MRLAYDKTGFTILLGMFAGLPALSIDMSAPTLALLPKVLNTTVLVAGLTLSLFMVGFAIGQFAGGRLSDRAGRRSILLVALAIYSLATGCCLFATTGPALVAARFLQGIGAGACAVQAMAIVQDRFRDEHARRKQSYVVVVIGIMPMLAPALGALMIHYFGWRSVHLVLLAGGLLLSLITVLAVEESHPHTLRRRSGGVGIRIGFDMLHEPWFFRIAMTNALSYGGIFAYIAGAPVIVMTRLGYSTSVYAGMFAATAIALTLGAFTNARLGKRGVSSQRLIMLALTAQAVANSILLMTNTKSLTIQAGIILPALVLCCFSRGVASPNLSHLAVSGHRGNAGLASAMVGLSQLLAGALTSAVVAAMLPHYGYKAVVLPMAVLSCTALLLWLLMPTPQTIAPAVKA